MAYKNKKGRKRYKKKYMKEYRQLPSYKNYMKEYMKIYQKTNKIAWNEWLESNGFGRTDKGFDYHHPNPNTKLFEIGPWIQCHSFSIERAKILRIELEKCIHLAHSEHKRLHNLLCSKEI